MSHKEDRRPVSGSIRGIVRPLRLGLLVKPTDQTQIRTAIRLASLYWGGRFFPLIPATSRVPRSWRTKQTGAALTAAQYRDGYLDAFEPDVLVNLSGAPLGKKHLGLPVVPMDVLLSETERNHRVEYGVGLNEVAQFFIAEELKYTRRHPLNLVRPLPKGSGQLLLAALHGELHHKEWDSLFAPSLSPQFVSRDVALDTLAAHDPASDFTVGRLSSYGLQFNRTPSGLHHLHLFALDATRPEDVFDYWNLRALGHHVIPIPLQSLGNPEWLKRCRQEVISTRRPPERPNGWWGSTLLLGARSIGKEHLDQCAAALSLPATPKDEGPYLHVQQWYPRIWGTLERGWDNAKAASFQNKELSHDFADARESIRIEVPGPSVASQDIYASHPRYACELYPRVWVNDASFAEVIPEGGAKVIGCLGGLPFEELRLTRRGPVALFRSTRDLYHLRIPLAYDVVSAWMEERGISVTPSGEGQVAASALRQVGGPLGTTVLTVPGVIEMLVEMSTGTYKTHKALRDGLLRARGSTDHIRDPNDIIRVLASKDVIRLGLEIPCESCGKAGWYSLDACKYDLECVRCTAQVSVRETNPDDLKLAYSPIGAFRANNSLKGALPLLLLSRFTHLVMRGGATSTTSIDLRSATLQNEADFCMFYRDDGRDPEWGEGGYDLVLGECKYEGQFLEADFRRMARLRDAFPGAILCFATLREALTAAEVRSLRRLAAQGRRGLGERPDTPLLILTRTELMAHHAPPLAWDETARPHGRGTLIDVCDATVVRYLGLPTWEQERVDRINAKFQRKT